MPYDEIMKKKRMYLVALLINKAKLKFIEKDGRFTYSPTPSLTCRLPRALNMDRS
jgi:hypothetical protein